MTPVVRYLPFSIQAGPDNMAADEALLHAAVQGVGSIRFYGWNAATISLGYFQPAAVRAMPPFHALPWVRRPTGGAMLVHHHELTYALALPPGRPWQDGRSWLVRMHQIIAAGLGSLSAAAHVALVQQEVKPAGQSLCFLHHTVGDLVSAAHKVAGSAQRKYRQALLQHGSILLRQSEHTPELPGLYETQGSALTPEKLADHLTAAFVRDTGWRVEAGTWTAEEEADRERLRADKYAGREWNEKR